MLIGGSSSLLCMCLSLSLKASQYVFPTVVSPRYTAPGEKPKVVDKAPVGRIYVDGNISVGEESQSIKDRKNLSYNGFLEITIIINNLGSIVKNPIISFKGIPSNIENNNFVFDLQDKIVDVCKSFSLKNSKQEQNLIEALRINCRKTVKEKTGKRPYTNVNLVRI